jgi:hypothetical protein
LIFSCIGNYLCFFFCGFRGISVERIHFDSALWTAEMLPKLKDFFTQARVPEMFTGRVKKGLPLFSE